MSERTPGPWIFERSRFKSDGEYDYAIAAEINGKMLCIAEVFGRVSGDVRPDAAATAAAIVKWENNFDALVKALKMQEDAELAHVNCDECNGEDVPELCPKCFPLFDDARIARRKAWIYFVNLLWVRHGCVGCGWCFVGRCRVRIDHVRTGEVWI